MSAAVATTPTLVRDREPELTGPPWLGEVVGLDRAQLEAYRNAKALRRGRFRRQLARPHRAGA